MFSLGRDAAGAALQVGGVLRGLLSVQDAEKSAGKKSRGGSAGGLGDAFGKLMGLIRPVIDLLSGVFQPLIDGIGAALRNVMAPLQMTMEMIAQDLGPKIAKLLIPLVGVLEFVVSNFGTMLSSLLDTGPVLGGITQVAGLISGVVSNLMPMVGRLVETGSTIISKILPIVFSLVGQLLPVVELIIIALGDSMIEIMTEIGKIWEAVGPLLVETFMALLTALLPLIPALLKLVVIIMKVMAPINAIALTAVLKIIMLWIPVIETLVGWISKLVDLIVWSLDWVLEQFGGFDVIVTGFTMAVDELFDIISGWMDQLFLWMIDAYDAVMYFWGPGIKDDVIDVMVNYIPNVLGEMFATLSGLATAAWTGFWGWLQAVGIEVLSWWSGLVGSIMRALGLDDVAAAYEGILGGLIAAIQAPLEAIKTVINAVIIDSVNSLTAFDLPLIGSLAEIVGIPRIPHLADGGITAPGAEARGGVPLVAGEAGQELILPLQPQVIRAVLAPALEGLELPGLDRVVTFLESIDRRLGGTLRVETVGGRREAPAAMGASIGLSDAVGIGGL